MADKQELHDRYKDLAKVESGLRTLKHGHPEIRPWHVTTEANTRAHAFTAMLALKVRRRLGRAWEPLNLTVESYFGNISGAMLCNVRVRLGRVFQRWRKAKLSQGASRITFRSVWQATVSPRKRFQGFGATFTQRKPRWLLAVW
jgi:hypothetical protein